MRCDDVRRDLPLLLYGELNFDEEERIESHLAQCSACRHEVKTLRSLHAEIDDSEVDVPAGLLAQCRRELRAAVAVQDERRTVSWLQRWLRADWALALKPLGALALVAIGFFGARLVPEQAKPETVVVSVPAQYPVATRVRSIEPDANGGIRVMLEETSQRLLAGSPDEDSIRNVLLTAARESTDDGVRVESIDALRAAATTSEAKTVLLFALENDPNPGVRLRALAALRRAAENDPEVRRVLARVLLSDVNPGIRVQAVDLLMQRRDPDVVDVLDEAMRRDDNNYVKLKCRRALVDLRASAESY